MVASVSAIRPPRRLAFGVGTISGQVRDTFQR